MKLIFDHSQSIFHKGIPLVYLDVEREHESAKYMLENGWVPFYDEKEEFWYQTKSARLKIEKISNKIKKELDKIKITNFTSNSNIEKPIGFEWYNYGNYEDFYFDNIFWGRVLFIEDQVIYTIMNKTNDKKSYGTLSYYYLLEKFLGKYDFLYITDYFSQFEYKKNLPNFEYWDGKSWLKDFD